MIVLTDPFRAAFINQCGEMLGSCDPERMQHIKEFDTPNKLREFIAAGNIRVCAESKLIDIVGEPTELQYWALAMFIRCCGTIDMRIDVQPELYRGPSPMKWYLQHPDSHYIKGEANDTPGSILKQVREYFEQRRIEQWTGNHTLTGSQ